jgi:hypothetical protein
VSKRVSLPGVEALFTRRDDAVEGGTTGEREGADHSMPAGPDTSMLAEAAKPQKFTFYFEPATLEALDEAWFALRRRLGQRVSKSAIVDHIVRDAVKDLSRLEELLSSQ